VQQQLPYFRGAVAPCQPDPRDDENHVWSLLGRMLRKVPVSNPTVMDDMFEFVDEYCRSHLCRCHPTPFYDWLASRPYDSARKVDLVAEFLKLGGPQGTFNFVKNLKVKAFIKMEAYPAITKAPRAILPRSDEIKVILGPMVHALEDIIFNLRDDEGFKYFIKFVPVEQRPLYCERVNRGMLNMYQYVTDMTAMEGSHKNECGLTCWKLWSTAYTDYPEIRTICARLNLPNEIVLGMLYCCVYMKLMTAEMQTSLFNGCTNLFNILHIVHMHKGRCIVHVEGDDGIIMSSERLDASDFEAHGLKVKLVQPNDPRLTSFCGMFFVQGWNMRNPAPVLIDLAWSGSFMGANREILAGLQRSKALSLLAEVPQCPIIGVAARRIIELTAWCSAVKHWGEDVYSQKKWATTVTEFNPSNEMREAFDLAFGVSPSEQIELESLLRLSDDHLHPRVESWLRETCVDNGMMYDMFAMNLS
jgi:hypothetical protein